MPLWAAEKAPVTARTKIDTATRVSIRVKPFLFICIFSHSIFLYIKFSLRH